MPSGRAAMYWLFVVSYIMLVAEAARGGGGRDKGGDDDEDFSFVVGPDALTFDDAEAFCQSIGSNLVSIHSDDERDAAQSLCISDVSVSDHGCWIGLSEDKSLPKPQRWTWTDGTDICAPACYGFNADRSPTTGADPWYFDEPNELGEEDCIHLHEGLNFEWNDISCTDLNFPICADEPSCCYGSNSKCDTDDETT